MSAQDPLTRIPTFQFLLNNLAGFFKCAEMCQIWRNGIISNPVATGEFEEILTGIGLETILKEPGEEALPIDS